jgi:UDP-2,4-diacetamido-2,4,6-trideoxy-beta-L-altropyranose hydrolase
MKIAFVVDGGKDRGMGHVQQSLTLARELKDKADVIFLTKSDSSVVSQIRNADLSVIRKSNDDEILRSLKEIKPQWIIIDKMDVEEDFAKEIKEETSSKLAIFTNITAANQYADMAVTADYGTYFKNTKFFDEKTGTLYYYGPRYWILRKEFCQGHGKSQKAAYGIARILIMFGGSDPLNITSAVLDELLGLKEHYFFDIILGAGFTFFDELNQILERHADRRRHVNSYKNIENVAELMRNADLVITSPGLSLFESLCVGTPVIAFHQNKIQKERTAQVYRGFIPTLSINDVNKLPDMILRKKFLNPNDDFIRNLQIGQGKKELVEEFFR